MNSPEQSHCIFFSTNFKRYCKSRINAT